MKLEDHPTVQRIRLKTAPSGPATKEPLDAGWLKQLVLDSGAHDVGFVEIGRDLNARRMCLDRARACELQKLVRHAPMGIGRGHVIEAEIKEAEAAQQGEHQHERRGDERAH